MKATVEIIKVTPDIATEWLAEKWGEQRTIRKGHIERLAADMIAGRFHLGPDAILRVKGKLANGQHRLSAVIESGKTQSFIVLESNDDELYKIVDAGLKRTVSDGLFGMLYAKVVPSIVQWVLAYDTGAIKISSRTGSDNPKRVVTQCELIDYCQSNQEILTEAAGFVTKLYQETKLMPQSIGGALYVIASKVDKVEQAKRFLQAVYMEGGNNAAGDFRNKLIANKGSNAKLTVGYLFGIMLKAFKSYCQGSRPGVLKWQKGEAFTTI
jgi:hypothetical protein